MKARFTCVEATWLWWGCVPVFAQRAEWRVYIVALLASHVSSSFVRAAIINACPLGIVYSGVHKTCDTKYQATHRCTYCSGQETRSMCCARRSLGRCETVRWCIQPRQDKSTPSRAPVPSHPYLRCAPSLRAARVRFVWVCCKTPSPACFGTDLVQNTTKNVLSSKPNDVHRAPSNVYLQFTHLLGS
jgi:hypothetical protein